MYLCTYVFIATCFPQPGYIQLEFDYNYSVLETRRYLKRILTSSGREHGF